MNSLQDDDMYDFIQGAFDLYGLGMTERKNKITKQEYKRQLAYIRDLDPDTLFEGCKALCRCLNDGDSPNEPQKHKQPCPRCGGDDRFRYSPDRRSNDRLEKGTQSR